MNKFQVNASDYEGAIVIEARGCDGAWSVPAWYEMGPEYADFAGCNGDCTFRTVAAADAALAAFMSNQSDDIISKLTAIGFQKSHLGGGCMALVKECGDYTWCATAYDGGDMPDDDDWLICEYRAADWSEGLDDVRAFDSMHDYLSDVIALIP